jgi:LPXTG-motif cell wall-anchored protein
MSDQITTTPNPPSPSPECPECGAKIRDPRATRCWMCHEPLTATARAEDRSNPFRLPDTGSDSPAWAVFGVLALLICGGLAFGEPGILLAMLIPLVPVLIRTLVATSRAQEAGAPLSAGATLLAFFSSVGVVAVVGAAAGIAFFITCFAVCLGGMAVSQGRHGPPDGVFLFAIVLGGLLALAIFFLLMRALWPRKG